MTNYTTKLEMVNNSPTMSRQLLLTTEELDRHFHAEYGVLMNLHLNNGHVYTFKLVEEVTRQVLTQMVFSGMFN